MPNRNNVSTSQKAKAEALIPFAVAEGLKILTEHCESYRAEIKPKIDEELAKLAELEGRHIKTIQQLDRRASKKRVGTRVDQTFSNFAEWVKRHS